MDFFAKLAAALPKAAGYEEDLATVSNGLAALEDDLVDILGLIQLKAPLQS